MTTPVHERRWIAPVVLIALIAWLALRESGALTIGDVFWHLRTGDLILSDGPPREDLFSWTAGGEQWRPNAWLGDVFWAATRSGLGEWGISILTGAFVVAIALLLYLATRRSGTGPWAAVASSFFAVIVLAPFISPRPLLFGFVLLPVVLDLVRTYMSGDGRSLFWVAVAVVAWANLHGSFVVGVAIIGMIAVGWAIDQRTLKGPARLAVTAVLAGLLNPYGPFSYLQALFNRAESGNIDEWQPLAFDDSRGVMLVIFMVFLVGALWRTRTEPGITWIRWTTVLPILLLTVATFWSVRMGSFLLVVGAPVVAAGLTALSAAPVRAWAATRSAAIVVGLLFAGVILAFGQLPELGRAGEVSSRFPEQLVAEIPAGCRLLNEYDLGGFIIDERWPEVLVSQDGRADLYGAEELDRQERWLSSADTAPIDAQGITCVVADRDRPLTPTLEADASWTVRARSNELVLLVRE